VSLTGWSCRVSQTPGYVLHFRGFQTPLPKG
jgi:hypothetical protein